MDPQTLLLLGAVLAVGLFLWWQLKQFQRSRDDEAERLSEKMLTKSIGTVLELAKQQLEGEKREIKTDLENKQGAIEKLVRRLEEDIKARQDEIRDLERDRNRQYGEVTKAVEEHRRWTEKLQVSAEQLNRVLSNNQMRGEWGEMAAERILESGGLVEGKHYTKQTQLGTGTRPDIILHLPGQKKVCVDVKFPFASLQALSQTKHPQEQKRLLGEFEQAVKGRIKEITSRDYISEEEGTLDFVILFIPSEMVFGFVNKNYPQVVDGAFAKRVVMASPHSFFAIVRMVYQAHRNFDYEQNIKEILRVVEEFVKDFRRFKDEFAGFGDGLQKLQTAYDQITATRYKKLDLRFRQIEDYRRGQASLDVGEVGELESPEAPSSQLL